MNIRKPSEVVNQIGGCLITDSRNVFDKLSTEVVCAKGAERRVDLTLMRLKESQHLNNVVVRWVHSDAQLANSLTKGKELRQILLFYDMNQNWRIVDDPSMSSARKRKEKGIQPLDNGITGEYTKHTLQTPQQQHLTWYWWFLILLLFLFVVCGLCLSLKRRVSLVSIFKGRSGHAMFHIRHCSSLIGFQCGVWDQGENRVPVCRVVHSPHLRFLGPL